MALFTPLTVGYIIAVSLGLATIFFGGRALSILRRPPTGEAAREIVFLTARDLVAPMGLVLLALLVEWVEWIVAGLRGANLVTMPSFTFYANLAQSGILLLAGIMAFRVLIPFTRARRTEHAEHTLDRLAARVALLRGRK